MTSGERPAQSFGVLHLVDAEYHRNYYKQMSSDRKSRKVFLQSERRRRIRERVAEYKANAGCECGEVDPVCLEFHHNSDDKEINIADACNRGWSEDRLESEMKKCIVLCANCHRKLHHRLRCE